MSAAPTLPLDLTYHEARALAGLLAKSVQKLERQHATPQAEAKRRTAQVEPFGERRDAVKWKIEQSHTLLQKLQALEGQYQQSLEARP